MKFFLTICVPSLIKPVLSNALYVSSNTGVYNAVSVKSSGRYTYKEIIQNGYGCSVLTVKNVITIKKDYTNTINHWAWGFYGNGNNGNRNAFRLSSTTFTKKAVKFSP